MYCVTIKLIEIYFQVLVFCFMHKHIRGAFNKFPDFFVQAFKIVVDS